MANLLEQARRALEANTKQGDADALATCDDILQVDLNNPHAMFMAGTALYRMKQTGLAALIFNTASQLKPDVAAVWNNYAISIREYHPQDAIHLLKKALECDPTHYEARKNLAACLGRVGGRAEAIELNTHLMEENPSDVDIPYNLALDLLHTDDWGRAFDCYRYSEGNAQRHVRNYHADKPTPRWNGHALEKIVIYGEQGVGDEILASAAYQYMDSHPGVILDCDPRLEGILKRSFPWATVYGTRNEQELEWPTEEEPECAMMAMALFGEFMDPEDRVEPWLVPDPVLVDMFTKLLDRHGSGKKIGLSWSGGAKEWDRVERTIPVEELGPITAIPDAVVVSLEYSDGPKPEGVLDLSWATRKGVDLDVTAALIASLDMVVSVPQTVCDIAGAVGTPLRALVSENPPWRFAEAAGDAWVWKDVKTYRKKRGGNWMPIIAKCARDIREDLV